MGREVSEHLRREGLMRRFGKHAVNEQTIAEDRDLLYINIIFQEKQTGSLPSFIQQCNNSNRFLFQGHRIQLISVYKMFSRASRSDKGSKSGHRSIPRLHSFSHG